MALGIYDEITRQINKQREHDFDLALSRIPSAKICLAAYSYAIEQDIPAKYHEQLEIMIHDIYNNDGAIKSIHCIIGGLLIYYYHLQNGLEYSIIKYDY
jgi:hypothetical protein